MNLDITSKNLYFIILRALLGFNIFHSLFSRSSAGDIECGSWFFPTLKGGSTGFMALGDLACGRTTQGKFIEALASSFFLPLFGFSKLDLYPKNAHVNLRRSKNIIGSEKTGNLKLK